MLASAGCNSGACHGSAKGKNGFKLSLRGYDANDDYTALANDLAGRRINKVQPERSLALLKPTGAVPHEGGKVLQPGSRPYDLVLGWIKEGVHEEPDTSTARPERIEVLPAQVDLDLPGRTQRLDYRSISPELAADRARIVAVQGLIDPPRLTAARNKVLAVPVTLARQSGFTGDVQVTLEGFASGRDLVTRLPTAITKFFVVTPLKLKPTELLGTLRVKVNGNSEVGTRMVVLRAETKVGNDTWVQYSPAFPLTVTEK